MSDNENIQVVVRCRGRNSKETATKSAVVVHVADDQGDEVLLNPSDDTGVSAQLNAKRYMFDNVFGPMADQQSLFNEVASPLFDEFLKGYNCTLLVYGMTSTGKTYTMSGENRLDNGQLSERAGIVPRVLLKLFDVLNDPSAQLQNDYIVKCSFVELYNEELKDLLGDDTNKKLRIYDQKQSIANEVPTTQSANRSAIYIQNLEEVILRSANHGLQTLEKGLKLRQVAATKMNDVSSRSHTIFTLNLFKQDRETGDLFRISKMNLVDLAGSENISRSGALNQRAKEAGSINQSLLTLGRVINLLVEKNNQHIPYRESKLTRLLQDSLGGRTKTCLIATISPAKVNYDETLSTLEYASKAKSIQNKPQLGPTQSKGILLRDLSSELSKIKADMSSMRSKEGIYMDNANYEEFMSDIQEYKTEIEEFKRTQDALKKHNEELRTQLQHSENQNNEFLTLINTLNATVQSLHNKIDEQKENENKLMNSSSKFKTVINSINENLAVFKQYESETKSVINTVNETMIHNAVENIINTITGSSKSSEVESNIGSIHNEINNMVTKLQTATYDACKSVSETILSKFPDLFKDFDSNVSELGYIISEFQSTLNEEFSKISKENNDFRSVLKDSLFQSHDSIVNTIVARTQQELENDANSLLNQFIEMVRESNNKQQKLVMNQIKSAVSQSISAEREILAPAQNKWEESTRRIINSCDSRTSDIQRQHSKKLTDITSKLKETSRFTSLSKGVIDEELTKINKFTSDIQASTVVRDNLDEIKSKYTSLNSSKIELIDALQSTKKGLHDINGELQQKIINNTRISGLEEQNVDKVMDELEVEQTSIRNSFLPTGKTPKREVLSLPRMSSSENLARSPPKFQLIGQRFEHGDNKENGNGNGNGLVRKRKSDDEPDGQATTKRSAFFSRLNRSLPDQGRIPRRGR